MKGKKTDKDFVASFILNCAQKGISDLDQILNCAQKEIEELNIQIMNISLVKQRRSNLMDVLDSLKKNNKDFKLEKLTLLFYQITNFPLAKSICESIEVKNLDNTSYKNTEAKLTIKQLCETKVLVNNISHLEKSINFTSFKEFLIKK